MAADYDLRLTHEIGRFADEEQVHDLPPVFHYWSQRYLVPKLARFGVTDLDGYFVDQLERVLTDLRGAPGHFISVGAGNCDTEIRLARQLVDRGHRDFVVECLEITDEMLMRGRLHAREAGVQEQVIPTSGDFNTWKPSRSYDAVLANQSLHHVVNLEGLLDAIRDCLPPHGRFVISDMIGRNGHQRWPEALEIVREFWAELPPQYRYHCQLRRQEPEFLDWDCSTEGFEGIRAQDILPLLVERFAFEDFLAFANIIDPFIDRGFGVHFDPNRTWDREFIDRVEARDDHELTAGTITPTHLIGTMRPQAWTGIMRSWGGLTPRFCIRVP